ncbi:NAD(P)/FAD-dependent oxidoreductase, partial [Methylopila musalis]
GPPPADAEGLARRIKAAPLTLTATRGVERAISTAGGVRLSEVDDGFMLRGRPGVFVAGEMLDWEAPTGGYLLQASFATGAAAGDGAASWLARMWGDRPHLT